MNRFQFAELNLCHRGNPEKTLNLVRRAVRMGYDSIVINIDIGEFKEKPTTAGQDQEEPPRKKKRRSKNADADADETPVIAADFIPDPFLIDESKLDICALEVAGKKFRQFSRLTANLSDSTSVHKLLQHKKLKMYDLVAVRVADELILETLPRKGNLIDLVSMECDDGKVPWLYKLKLIQACVTAGIYFELSYAKALFNSENRRQFFSNARSLIENTRGGCGVVLSSGAEELISIRAPYDTCNMCTLFGLEPKQGRKFVSGNAKDVLLRAQARKTIRGAMHVSADLHSIPSASGRPSEETLQSLSQIPEFQAQMSNQPKEVGEEPRAEMQEDVSKSKKRSNIFELFT